MKIKEYNKISGFTLIEVMITVVIIAIIATVAIPSYQSQMAQSRRSDAKIHLLEIMNRQDVFKSNYGVYTAVILAPGGCTGSACGLNLASANSKEGYYSIAGAAGPTGSVASSIQLTATPVGGGKQDGDACGNFVFDSTGVKSVSGSGKCW